MRWSLDATLGMQAKIDLSGHSRQIINCFESTSSPFRFIKNVDSVGKAFFFGFYMTYFFVRSHFGWSCPLFYSSCGSCPFSSPKQHQPPIFGRCRHLSWPRTPWPMHLFAIAELWMNFLLLFLHSDLVMCLCPSAPVRNGSLSTCRMPGQPFSGNLDSLAYKSHLRINHPLFGQLDWHKCWLYRKSRFLVIILFFWRYLPPESVSNSSWLSTHRTPHD